MVTNILSMGKLRQGVMAVAAGLALAGCNEANAEDNTQADIQQMAAVTEVQLGTCNQIDDLLEKLKCENAALKAQRESKAAEIAALDVGLESDAETIVEKRQILETEQTKNDQRRTTVDVLINEIGNQALQDSSQR